MAPRWDSWWESYLGAKLEMLLGGMTERQKGCSLAASLVSESAIPRVPLSVPAMAQKLGPLKAPLWARRSGCEMAVWKGMLTELCSGRSLGFV